MKNDNDKFKIGSDYTFEMLMPSPNDILSDIVKAITGSSEEKITVQGPIIYNDGVTAIIKVKSYFYELDSYLLSYDEVSNIFHGFVDDEHKFIKPQKYLCMDIRNEESRYFKDPETYEIHEAVFDEKGEFLGYDYSDEDEDDDDESNSQDLKELLSAEAYDRLKNLHTIISSDDNFNEKAKKLKDLLPNSIYEKWEKLHSPDEDTGTGECVYSTVIISLTPSAAGRMERDGVLEQVDDCSILSQGFNRAVKWLTICNCAIVTAWRDGKPRKVNDENNKALQTALRELGYGVYKVMGFYAEIGKDIRRENSYLVFDQDGTRNLRNDVYLLSEQYEQDCFLYSAKGNAPAILVGTNDKFGKGRCVELGQIEINNHCRENYSKVGNGIISFG